MLYVSTLKCILFLLSALSLAVWVVDVGEGHDFAQRRRDTNGSAGARRLMCAADVPDFR
jgi:hypothetical protein